MYSEQDYQSFLEDPELLKLDREELARAAWETAYNKGVLDGMRRMLDEAEVFDDYAFAGSLTDELRYIYETEKEFIG